jgi:hypothetical protein
VHCVVTSALYTVDSFSAPFNKTVQSIAFNVGVEALFAEQAAMYAQVEFP